MILEIVFMKHCAPKHLLVNKDGALFQDKCHLKFDSSSFTTIHTISADQMKLLAIIFFFDIWITSLQWPNLERAIS